jgi:microcin C transport system ATP-binding protein
MVARMSDPLPLLDVRNLSISVPEGKGERTLVKPLSFTLAAGETLALVGESGSGKSLTALSLLRLISAPLVLSKESQVWYRENPLPVGEGRVRGNPDLDKTSLTPALSQREREKIDLASCPLPQLRSIRGNRIGMIFQEPMTALNPLHPIGRQIAENILLHQPLTKPQAKARVVELLEQVGLGSLTTRLHAYPHELSGGQRQRVMIAMAIANSPALLIADEPTTALDVTVQAQVLQLLRDLQRSMGMAMLLITHDLHIVRDMADRVLVMRHGEKVEEGATNTLFAAPQHDYTKALIAATPSDHAPAPLPDAVPLLTMERLSVAFPKKRVLNGKPEMTPVVRDVSLTLYKGETLGLVGESGSGKTTLALALLRLVKSTGTIRFGEEAIEGYSTAQMRPLRRRLQMVFQDPYSSLNPRMMVRDILLEGLRTHRSALPALDPEGKGMEWLIDRALTDVGMEVSAKHRYPHAFSGGQRQRISIARALVLRPELIILDEPTSALDVLTQAQVLHLLRDLQQRYQLTYLLISHNLPVVRCLAHRTAVLKGGEVVEYGASESLFSHPAHAYTRELLKAVGMGA